MDEEEGGGRLALLLCGCCQHEEAESDRDQQK